MRVSNIFCRIFKMAENESTEKPKCLFFKKTAKRQQARRRNNSEDNGKLAISRQRPTTNIKSDIFLLN